MFRKTVQKILLVNPQISIYPAYDDLRIAQSFGLACISGALRACGDYEVKFLDAAAEGAANRCYIDNGILKVGLPDEKIANMMAKEQPDIVAISNLHTAQFLNAINIGKIAKNVDKKIVTVLGGVHASLNYAEALATGYIDFVIIGEGERRFCQLIEVLTGKREFGKCDGIAMFQENKITFFPPKDYITDLDALPDPDFTIFDKTFYPSDVFYSGVVRGNFALPYVSSRGCPQQCKYCCSNEMWGSRLRFYSVETILRHLDAIKSLGYDEVLFEDDNLLVNPTLAKAVFKALNEKGFIWSLTGGLDRSRLTNDIVDMLISNGCARVNIGIESENLMLLRQYHKYRGVPDARLELSQHVRKLTEGGVETFGDFMIGFPEQTMDDIRKTIDYAKRLKENGLGVALFHVVTSFPGTRLYQECQQKGYLREGVRWEDFTFAKSNLNTPNFSAEQMTELRIKAYIEVNGQEMWETSRKTLQRPNLVRYYASHPENKWSKFFSYEMLGGCYDG